MTGVPSSRGCEACRKQKKKCSQTKPMCSRCKRLQIPCKGAGEKRWTFKSHQDSQEHNSLISKPTKKEQPPWSCETIFLQNPSNETTQMSYTFVYMLDGTDLRHNLPSSGRFLNDVPRRLGKHEALDAAVSAFTTVFASVQTRKVTAEMLRKYGRALKALRTCLSNPKDAQTVETLCTIYLIMLCQPWLYRKGDECYMQGHAEAMAHILNARAEQDSLEDFNYELVITLGVTVIGESVFNPNIHLNPKLWKVPKVPEFSNPLNDNECYSLQSLSFHLFAKGREFAQDPSAHITEIQRFYEALLLELPKIRRCMTKIISPPCQPENASSPETSTAPQPAVPLMSLNSGCVFLSLAILLNGVLRAVSPYDSLLVSEWASFEADFISLANEAAKRRPLGASYIPLCLIPVWATTEDEGVRGWVEGMLRDYEMDFGKTRWMEIAVGTRGKLELLRQEGELSSGSSTYSSE